MKKIVLAAALSLAASTAFAGGMAQPVMEAPIVAAPAEVQTSSSGAGLLIPILLLIVLAAAAANA